MIEHRSFVRSEIIYKEGKKKKKKKSLKRIKYLIENYLF